MHEKSTMLNYDSVIDELRAAYEQNKQLKEEIKRLKLENKDLKDSLSKIYDAQNG